MLTRLDLKPLTEAQKLQLQMQFCCGGCDKPFQRDSNDRKSTTKDHVWKYTGIANSSIYEEVEFSPIDKRLRCAHWFCPHCWEKIVMCRLAFHQVRDALSEIDPEELPPECVRIRQQTRALRDLIMKKAEQQHHCPARQCPSHRDGGLANDAVGTFWDCEVDQFKFWQHEEAEQEARRANDEAKLLDL